MSQQRNNTKWKKKRNKYVHKKENRSEEPDKHLGKVYKQLIQTFRNEIDLVLEYIKHCSEEQLMWSQAAEQWNIKQQSGYLGYYIEYQGNIINAFLNEMEFSKEFKIDKKTLPELFNNSSIENIIAQLNSRRKFLLEQLYVSRNRHWQARFFLKGEERSLSILLTDMVTYISELREDIFMNLQRYKVWYKPLEEVTET